MVNEVVGMIWMVGGYVGVVLFVVLILIVNDICS